MHPSPVPSAALRSFEMPRGKNTDLWRRTLKHYRSAKEKRIRLWREFTPKAAPKLGHASEFVGVVGFDSFLSPFTKKGHQDLQWGYHRSGAHR